MMTTIATHWLAIAVGFLIGVLYTIREVRIAREYERESQETLRQNTPSMQEKAPEAPSKARVPFLSLIQRKELLSDNEFEFFQRLEAALPEHYIFAQVALSGLIAPISRLEENERTSVFRKFSQKRADYVVCTKELRAVAVIELDDKLHIPEADKLRDGLLRAGGYEIVRYQSHQKPSVAELSAAFKRLGILAS